ncbi:DUF960 family protein [Enterococcus hulanensis]|uniref:DUF960 family protein n=1 Tax=Enterococcus hulanensis TaxID=2559929 RepID=A0ABU3F1D4_9ENTE|nr:DUF960 family protein [Enterococcus hulanensis]MDT2600943.1 DUF960 family protein [Enterococcus hulanensis]MDT2611531.1 DUF960 family protein [Enterococcus hulanensis]MDT2617984.1 DUF960 family protein [Enterococcus hulanensis]MDT2628987.1 DUF960 family protein [Enterococcus hulanensis]MDT2656549.1 DUF960 family protein [Enterococcus hulanensis]
MFDTQENRYITRGVNERVPKEIQQRCFQLIDEKVKQTGVKLDYLQIFEFNGDDQRGTITIIHRQEEPFFINYHECRITNDLTSLQVKKLWVIDDHTHQTMLLPEEY